MPLPDEPFAFAEWKRCRVGLDYHVEIGRHHYSVPSTLVRQEVEARVTDATVEIFLRGKRVASHLRSRAEGRATSVTEHMPSAHRRHREWTHDRIRREAARMGADAATLIDAILEERPHPEQGFRSAIGILGLAKRHGPSASMPPAPGPSRSAPAPTARWPASWATAPKPSHPPRPTRRR